MQRHVLCKACKRHRNLRPQSTFGGDGEAAHPDSKRSKHKAARVSISGFYVGATKHEIVRYEFQKVRKNKQQLLVSYGQINKKKERETEMDLNQDN